jgi:chorismate mutase
MPVRGIRGATTVSKNDKTEIVTATRELLTEIVKTNNLLVADIAAAIFTVTLDLNAEFPAVAAREIGWHDTPLLCAGEINVPGSLAKCIRVLLTVNSDCQQTEINHVYLKDAVNLRR